MRIKQSFCYPLFKTKEMSLDTLCQEAAAIGYAAIELWFRGDDFDALVAAAQKHGLVIASMCGHKSLQDGMNNPAEHDRIEAELRESLELAARLGIPGLICFSGNRREGQSEEEAMDACVACLKRVTPLAEKLKINLNMELLNSKVNHPGYQCDHTAWGVEMCSRTGSDRAKLLYDIYHMQIMEGDIIRTIGQNSQWFGHYHTAGNPGRNDMDDQQELSYPAIMRAIAATGYDLYVGHEFTPKADRMAALKTAWELCNVKQG